MNTKFIVNKEKKFTKAISTDFVDVITEISKDPSLIELELMLIGIVNNGKHLKTINRIEFSAMCKCSDDDKYDETIGKDVAEEKACLKYHKAMVSDYKYIIKKLNSFINIINKKIEKHEKKITNITNHISKY